MIDRYDNKHHSSARPPDDGTASPEAAPSPHSDFEELFQNLHDAAILTDMTGSIVHANERATQFLMFDRAELCGMSVLDIITGSDDSLLKTLCENIENERFTLIEANCKRKDDSTFPGEIAVSKLHLRKECLVFFIRNITRRIQMEQKLRKKG